MKILKTLIISLGIAATFFLYMSCDRSRQELIATTDNDFSNASLVQVVNATVNSTGTTHVFVDGAPVTGAALTFGNVFPASGYAFKVKPGLRSFSIRSTSAGTTQTPIIFSENLDINKNYIIFMYDTITSAKQITVLNDIVIPADSTARVKFANFIYNSADLPAVDIFSKRRNENIFTNISKTVVTGFIPYASSVSDTLLVRETGTLNLLAQLNGFFLTPKRSYTLIYRGSHKGTRVLASFTND